LGKLLIYFSGSKNFSGLRFLLHHASIDPDRQIQILKTFPLGADSISLTFRNNDGEFVYPSLAPETIQYLLKSDNPTVWDLVICQKQCEDRRFEQWDAVRLEDLQPIIEFFNFNNCVDLATSQKSSYWESSLLKVVVESLSDKQVTAFFGLLLEKKSHACLPALRDTLKKRNVTAIEGFHLLPPQIIPFNYDPLYEDDTILSYRLTQQEFLASCSRRDLCSFLHRGISDTAGDHLIEEIQKQDLSSFATIEELTTVSYALFLSVTSSVRPAFEPASISADAIRWLANGDRDYFLWLLRELLHKNPTLHSTGRIPPCRSGIKGHEKERLLEERAFFWLAQAVTDTESTKAPDWVTEVVTRSPETFGFVLGQWEAFKSKDQKYRLRLLIKSLQLEEETIKRFGSAYAMEIDDRYRQLTMRQAPGREILNKIVEYGQTQSLEGNAIIETFASALVFEEQCCTVMPSEIKNNGPFVQLPRDVFEYLCHFLEPEDLARTATTCRHLFVQICGPQSRVWKHKKLGSMRAVKEMACLYYSLEMRIQIISQLATHTDEYRQGEELNTCNRFLRQALFLAWPAKRLLHLGRDVYSEGKDLVRSSLLLFGKDADGKSFIKPGKNRLAQIFDRMGYRGAHRTVIARFLRDNPVYFTYPRWAKDVVRISSEAWKLLERFGLPWSGVEPFCKGIMTCCDRAGGWNNFPENIRIRFINVLKRLQEDHPHFSFENKIPEECLVLMAL